MVLCSVIPPFLSYNFMSFIFLLFLPFIFLSSFPSDTSMCTIINTNRRRNNDYFDRSLTRQKVSQGQRIIKSDNNKTKKTKTRRTKSNTVTEQPKAIMSQSDQEAFQTHFGNNVEDFQKGFLIQRIDRNE